MELCRAAAADGTDTIIATPHVLREPWLNTNPAARDALLDELNQRLGGKPAVLPGCESYFTIDAVELWQQGAASPLTALNRTRYLLVEFPANRVPREAESVVHELVIAGVHPVIAHPERNLDLARNAARLQRLQSLGAYAQITAASVLGKLGTQAQKTCDDFFARGLVHFIASDAHSTERRPPALSAARERVRKIWGADAEKRIFEKNPRALVEDQPLPAN